MGVSGALGRVPYMRRCRMAGGVVGWQVALPDGGWRCRVADHRGLLLGFLRRQYLEHTEEVFSDDEFDETDDFDDDDDEYSDGEW